MNWRLALITLALGPIVVLIALVFRRLARRAMQQAQRAQADRQRHDPGDDQRHRGGQELSPGSALYTDFQSDQRAGLPCAD